jgi:hypothetical protein
MPNATPQKDMGKTGQGMPANTPTTKSNPVLKALPVIIIISLLGVAALSQLGYITLPRINLPFGLSDTIEIKPDATVGVPSSYEFSALVQLLGVGSGGGTDIYTYYLGSGVGFPPMGLTLGIDGVLKGTPTAAGTSKFQVCVKDVGGRSTCQTYSLTVNPAGNSNATSCPTTSNPPCGSVQNGVGVSAVIVPGSCACPSDTNFSQMDNISAGGPYRICTCK